MDVRASDRSSVEPSLILGERDLDEVEALMIHLAFGRRLDRLGRMLHEHLGSGGRRMRARLALAAADALGVEPGGAVGWAAACELLHNATLVHDDLQDGDRMRRGRPSLWATYGAAQAINAGDLLLILPNLALEALAVEDGVRWRLARILAERAERTVRGQSAEMVLVAGRRLDWDAWALAAEGKSGALLALPVEGAAILAGLAAPSVGPIGAAFSRLGVLYQLHDDVRDLWGDKGREKTGNDLREGKPSAVVAAHLSVHPEDTARLVAVLEKPRAETTDDEVAATVRLFEGGGALWMLAEQIADLRRDVLECPTLRALPDLRAIASGLVAELEAAAPAVLRAHL